MPLALVVMSILAAGEDLSKVTLVDSQELRGVVTSETPEQITLRLGSGAEMPIARTNIRSVERETGARVQGGHVWSRDRNRTRYFYAPSAMMLF